MKGSDFIKIIFFILFYKSPQQRVDFLQKKWMSALQKHHEGKRFYTNIFFILFYRSPQQRVDFMQKKGWSSRKSPNVEWIICKSPQQSVDFLQKK